jgi:hypothetical protein
MVHPNCSECGAGSYISQDYFRIARRFAFVHQEHEFGSPDVDRIAVFNDFATHRNSIHKRTVVAVEIDDLILLTHLLDHAMFARDHGVDKAQLIRFVTANRCLATDQLSNSPCQRTRDGE